MTTTTATKIDDDQGLNEGPRDDVVPFLARVERALKDALIGDASVDDAPLGERAAPLVLAGGAKRARPRLIHAVGRAVGAETAALVDLAVAAELIHAGSLLHDDVIDAGTERRGLPTVNATDGNLVAVLAGDFLLARALATVAPWGSDVAARAAHTLAEMVQGVSTESAHRGRAVSLTTWTRIAEQKTGALFAFSASGPLLVRHVDGARTRDAVRAIAATDRAGRAFGVLFQLADDVLDFSPGRGKDPFADLRNASPNVVVTLAAERGVRAPHGDGVDEAAGARFVADAVRAGVGRDVAQVADRALDEIAGLLDVCGREALWMLEEARALSRAALSVFAADEPSTKGARTHEGLHGPA